MHSSFDLTLKNGKCFIDGQLKTTDIGISNGIIKSIGKIEQTPDEKILELKIEDYKIVDDFHTSFLVEDHLNRAVEI